MSTKSKVKYLSEFDVNDSDVLVKKPFRINQENKRRFIRVEISSPISMHNLKEKITQFSEIKEYSIQGTIFNISANGLLVEIHESVALEDFLLMKFTIQDVETIDSVLGVVKRIESEDDSHIVGIEFLTPSVLQDRLSKPEIELLQENISNFNDGLYKTIEKYLYKK